MKAALLIDQEFQDAEVIYPYYRLQEAGFEVELMGREAGLDCVGKYGYTFTTDKAVKKAKAKDYALVVVPGGNAPDKMRTFQPFVDFCRDAHKLKLPIGAICHGPSLLIDADVVTGKHVTSYVAIRRDLENAGAVWRDRDVEVDDRLVTSRKPDDLPAFLDALLRLVEAPS